MTTPQEPLESIRERARRALRDNDEARLQAQVTAPEVPAAPHLAAPMRTAPPLADSPFRVVGESRAVGESQAQPVPAVEPNRAPAPAPQAEPAVAPSQLERRLKAIAVVRELEPRRSCFRRRVQELQQRLGQTPTDSIHFAQLLQRLAEGHAELNRLEGQMEEAQHVIRSTEWLMEMLTDPTRFWGRQAGEELDAVAR